MRDSNTISEILTPNDLADFLRVSRTTVYRLVESRDIKFYKVGGSLRFNKADVELYLDKNCVESIQNMI